MQLLSFIVSASVTARQLLYLKAVCLLTLYEKSRYFFSYLRIKINKNKILREKAKLCKVCEIPIFNLNCQHPPTSFSNYIPLYFHV